MARAIKHKLTPAEVACGVTLEQVADLPPTGLFIDRGCAFVLRPTPRPQI